MFFIRAKVQIFSFGERLKYSIQLGFASLNRTFHHSPHENICSIALLTLHYLYADWCRTTEQEESVRDTSRTLAMLQTRSQFLEHENQHLQEQVSISSTQKATRRNSITCANLVQTSNDPVYTQQKSSGSQSKLRFGSRFRICTHLHRTFIVLYNQVHHIVLHC